MNSFYKLTIFEGQMLNNAEISKIGTSWVREYLMSKGVYIPDSPCIMWLDLFYYYQVVINDNYKNKKSNYQVNPNTKCLGRWGEKFSKVQYTNTNGTTWIQK